MSAKMKINEYPRQAMKTAIYPGKGETEGLVYAALGLAGESGEIANKVKKVMRDCAGRVTMKKRAEIANELGDVLWYAAALADVLTPTK